MKGGDIKVGETYAFMQVPSSRRKVWTFDRHYVTKVTVVSRPRGSKVQIRLMQDATTRFKRGGTLPHRGEIVEVRTGQVWMPWADYEKGYEEAVEEDERASMEQEERDRTLADLRERIDAMAPREKGEDAIRWGHGPSGIVVSAGQLGNLLASGEAG